MGTFFVGLFTILVLAHIWFWAACAVLFFVLLSELDDVAGWITFECLLICLCLAFGYRRDVLNFFSQPWLVAKWLGIYFAGGIVWGFIKWTAFVYKFVGKYNTAKAEILAEHATKELTPELAAQLRRKLINSHIPDSAPRAERYKAKIVKWMMMWPFSIVGTLLRDVVKDIWNHIHTFCTAQYNKISGSMYKSVETDMMLIKKE